MVIVVRKLLISALTAACFAASAPSAPAHFTIGCKTYVCRKHVTEPHAERLARMHSCEARGVGWFYDGKFDGGLQFSPRTWAKTGSKYKFAFQAPISEQKYRAVVWAWMIKWQWRSTAGWPNCG